MGEDAKVAVKLLLHVARQRQDLRGFLLQSAAYGIV